MENEDELKVVILDNNIDIKTIRGVKLVRVKSSKYNLLIMKGYLPVIGFVDGSVTIESHNTITYENIRAIFSNSHNVFYLIIKVFRVILFLKILV